MNAVTPSSASERTWKATSSRLCRFTTRAASGDRRDERCISSPNRVAAEALGVAADGAGVERLRRSARAMRVGERLRRRLVDEDAGLAGDDGFERAAAAERDDRPSAGLRLERDDAEVFFAGQQRHRRAPVQLANLVVGRRPRNSHVGAGAARSSAARSGPSPTIFSGTPASAAGVDRQVDALVGDQRRHDEREPLGRGRRPGGRTRCRRADTPQSARDYSIGGSCPQHNERSRHSGPRGPPCRGPTAPAGP